jgi:hypothetical protein
MIIRPYHPQKAALTTDHSHEIRINFRLLCKRQQIYKPRKTQKTRSGFSGHQGAVRSAFLATVGITPEAFAGTNAAKQTLSDVLFNEIAPLLRLGIVSIALVYTMGYTLKNVKCPQFCYGWLHWGGQ